MKRSILITSLLAAACIAVAGPETVNVFQAEDTGPLIRVKNNFSETLTVHWHDADSAVGAAAYVGSTSNTLNIGTFYSNITALTAQFLAVTNSAGKKLLEVDNYCSLGTDVFTNKIILTDFTVAPGAWGVVGKWDTSACLFFNAYLPQATTVGGPGQKAEISRVHGNAGGTGNITLSLYADGSLAAQKIIVSPVYRLNTTVTSDTATATTSDDVTTGIIDWPFQYPVGRDKNIQIRATRATTATTGGIGAIVEPKE